MATEAAASAVEGEPGQILARAEAQSSLVLPVASKAEMLELLAQSVALYESVALSLSLAQASGEAANGQLAAAVVAAADGASGGAALDRARQANAGTLTALRSQVEEAQAALATERALRIAAEEKLAALEQHRPPPQQHDGAPPPHLVYQGSSSLEETG